MLQHNNYKLYFFTEQISFEYVTEAHTEAYCKKKKKKTRMNKKA
jgi:hypothetical protein